MYRIKKGAVWFCLLSKRFLKKYIFLLLLAAVPFLVLGMRLAAGNGESGVLHVLLYQEDMQDSTGGKIVDGLMNKQGIIRYTLAQDREEALEQVRLGEADCAWIFPAVLGKQIRRYLQGEEDSILTVYAREDTVQLQLAREQLYGQMYSLLSYELTRKYLAERPQFARMNLGERERLIAEFYRKNEVEGSIFRFAYLDDRTMELEGGEFSYLTAPLRGMLCILVLLCGMAVTMFYLEDEKDGLFVWMPIRHRKLFPWLYILTGTIEGAAAAYAALWASGTFTGWGKELTLMAVYVLMAAGFCNLLRVLVKNVQKFGACIPVLILVCLVLCPVFIDLKLFPAVRYLLPPYYYLSSLHSPAMLNQMIVCTGIFGFGGVLLDFLSSYGWGGISRNSSRISS